MSVSNHPAAIPEPNSTPATPAGTNPQAAPARGLLASMLAPVEPARTAAFNLDPNTANGTPTTGAVPPAQGVSSTAFHGGENNGQDTSSTKSGDGSGKKQQGIMRAWLLAGAARWARGGGTQNKRLDMHKARAAAHQVKESRTVNSGAGAGPGRGSSASGGSKALGSKTSKGPGPAGGGAGKGPKNLAGSGGGPGRVPAGRDNNRGTGKSGAGPKPGSGGAGGGRGTSGGTSPDSKGTSPTPKKQTPGKTDTPTPKPSKTAPVEQKNGKPSPAAGSTNGGKGAAGSAGKGTASPKPGAAPKGAANTPNSGAAKDAKGNPDPAGSKKWSLTKGDKTANGGTATPPAAPTGTKPGTGKSKTDPKAIPNKPKADAPAGQKPPAGKGAPFTTRPSRETGYRDGTRAARTTAHVKAYRDGIKDGWVDTLEVADREKTRLDQAHADRKAVRQEPPVTTASSADHHPAPEGAQPIKVDQVDATNLRLGDGAARTTISRGEVRSLKQYERRLTERLSNLHKVAETTKHLQAHAESQAQKALTLLEQAKGVKGGDKLTGALTRLHDSAKAQAIEAAEIHKRAVRSADTCQALLANVTTRYAGMYQAVVDSPETVPAELAYYQGA